MKTKRILSMVIASAMAMQCAAFSVMAENTAGVTVVANDIDTDWSMTWNWERYEDGHGYFLDWELNDGLTIVNDGAKYKAANTNKFSANEVDGVMVKVPDSGERKIVFRTDAAGNVVAYDENDTTSKTHLWYHQGRPNVLATFNVGEKSNDGQPLVISFDYKSTNPATGTYGNGPATLIAINGAAGEAFKLFNNAGNNGFAVQGASGLRDLVGYWDPNADHSIKLIISPELTADGRFEMKAIAIDGVVTYFEDMYGSKAGEKDVTLKSLVYSSMGNNNNYTDKFYNLVIERGIAPITATASVADGAKDVIPENITVNFSDAVALSEGAIKVYENGAVLPSNAYTVEMSEDSKTAVVSVPEYKGLTAYKLVVDKALIKGTFGETLSDGIDVDFVTAKKAIIVANDIDTDWKMTWNWERYEDGHDYFLDWGLDDGLTIVNDGAKYKAANTNKFSANEVDGVMVKVPDSGERKIVFRTDAAGNVVAYDENDTTSETHLWYHQGRPNVIATFDVGETSNNGQALVISFDYKSTNPATGTYGNGPATLIAINGAAGEAFKLFNNAGNNGFSVQGSSGLKDLVDYWDPNADHSVKLIISPELTADGRFEMKAIEIDGVVTKLENMYGSKAGEKDVTLKSLTYSSMGNNNNYTDKFYNLVIKRSDETVNIASTLADGATDIVPENIEINFTSPVELSDGAVKVYENGDEMPADAYTVTLSDDAMKAYVSIPEYRSRAAYKLVVDKALVNGVYGGAVNNGLEINFVSAKKTEVLEGSENLAANAKFAIANYGGHGQKFTTVETDADGVTTITVDNDTWNKAKTKNAGLSGNQEWLYDINGDGTDEKIGYASWDFSGVDITGIADVKNSTEPIVISMDYAFENAGSNKQDIWTKMGDSKTAMFYFTPFGANPNVSGSSWDGSQYASRVTEADWHSVQYVIDPVLNENNKSSVIQITQDGDVLKDTNGNWISYGTAKDADAANGQYVDSFEARLKLVVDKKDANGAYLPTVLKVKNLKVLRAGEFTAVMDNDALSIDDNTLNLRFSDPVTEAELSNLKIMKGAEVVENAIDAVSVSADGLSADVTVNLDATARYNVVLADVANIYGVKASTEAIAFEYYNTNDGYVTIVDGNVSDDGTNTTVAFTFTGTMAVSPVVIAAAYDENMGLIGMNTTTITISSTAYVSDSIVLENVTGADKVQLMAWDGFENMKPYCLAKIFE